MLPKRVSFSPVDNDRLLVMEATGLVGIWDVPSRGTPQLFASIAAGRHRRDVFARRQVRDHGRHRWARSLVARRTAQLKWVSQSRASRSGASVAISTEHIVSGGEDGAIRLWRHDGTPLGEIAEGA